MICGICVDALSAENCAFPACGHQFDKACLKEFFQDKIKSKSVEVESFKCPQCNKPFDNEILVQFLDKALLDTYYQVALDKGEIFGLQPYEQFTDCYNPSCKERFIIWKDAEYQECPSCSKKYCRECKYDYHENMTCQMASKYGNIGIAWQDQKFYEDAKKLGLAMCPKCKMMAEKISGCNFMTCQSKTCQGKVNYCNLCDTYLTREDHNSHFEKNSPFSDKCRVKVDGKWVDRKDAPVIKVEPQPIKQDLKKKDNAIPCPGCNCVDPTITEFLYSDQVARCISNKCYGNLICVTCKQTLEEYEVDDHFDSQFNCKYC